MDKIDQVRSLLSSKDDGIIFPNVVVVGDQSSGKSTLLESLSLVELPKGSGIVTRCPLVLRLRKANERRVYRLLNDNEKVQLDETKIDILKYIEQETKKLAGNNKNVVHDLIELLVEDPSVRDLTVVDLPGIARNPIADQPKDIHDQTTALIRRFIGQEGSVILCVFPANVDIATVESFTLAREFDPSGTRTIGVITKSDLAPNDDVLIQQLLMEKPDVLHLKLGFVAVRNRSTGEKISLEDARKREKEFFTKRAVSAAVDWDCLGIDALINRLADLYAERVKETFPKMRAEVQKKLKDVCDQLSKFPLALETPAARLAKYYELAEFYVEEILKVRFTGSNDGRQVSTVNVLHGRFKKFEEVVRGQNREFTSPKYRVKVRDAMAACFGEQLPNFLPHPVLKRLIGEKLDQLWSVADTLINECFDRTSRLLLDGDRNTCKDNILLLKLLPAFRNTAIQYLNGRRQDVLNQLQELIRLEKHDPYTMNHYYMETVNEFRERAEKRKVEDARKKKTDTTATTEDDDESMFESVSNDDQAVQDMLISIYAFWKLITKRFMDYTALSLRAGCVFDVCSGIRHRLRQLPAEDGDLVDACLAEDSFMCSKRKQLQKTKERLERVDAILGGGSTAHNESDALAVFSRMGISSSKTLDNLADDMSRRDADERKFDSIIPPVSVPTIPAPAMSHFGQTNPLKFTTK